MWRIVLAVGLLCWSADGQVTCRDHNGGAVDWLIMYKVPKLNNKGTTGLEYLYMDSAGKKMETSKTHKKLINDHDGVLGHTLKPLFTTSMPKDFGFITYNDQPPEGFPSPGDKFGHSKGLVMMGKTTGVWLLHSTPRFPFKRDNNFWPPSGAAKAQTFICVTFNYDEFQKIGDHLLDIAAFPFDSHVPADFHDQLKKAAIKEWNNRKPGQKIQDLKSDAGTQFKSIAKNLYKLEPTGGGKSRRRRAPPTAKGVKKITKAGKAGSKGKKVPSAAKLKALSDPNRFEGDLYLTIAKTYDTDVRVQTWGCQSGRDGSYCEKNQRHVIKVTEVKADLGGGEVQWKTTVDHSKWCISETKDLICIADVNRGLKQYERPGGALCFIHKEASQLFQGVIAISEECKSSSTAAGSTHVLDLDLDPDCDPDCDDDDPDCTPEPMEVE